MLIVLYTENTTLNVHYSTKIGYATLIIALFVLIMLVISFSYLRVKGSLVHISMEPQIGQQMEPVNAIMMEDT